MIVARLSLSNEISVGRRQYNVTLTRAARRSAVRGSSAWAITAVGIASTLAIPSLGVLVSLAHAAHDVWVHLWPTQLLELVGNTLALLAGVGAGALVVGGTGLAWLVVTYRFPGRGILEWALVLPLAVPAYVIGFAFLGLFDFTGPVQIALRRWLGTGVRLRSSGRTGASSC
jgi:iron(III) transport system permease protein